jgi:hypothetical protein
VPLGNLNPVPGKLSKKNEDSKTDPKAAGTPSRLLKACQRDEADPPLYAPGAQLACPRKESPPTSRRPGPGRLVTPSPSRQANAEVVDAC